MPPRERLRIAHVTYGVQPRGGVVHALALTEALCDLGEDAVLFALDDTGHGLFRAPRCPVTYVPVSPAETPEPIVSFVRRRIDALVDAFGSTTRAFDVYHAHDGIGGNALATLVERRAIDGYVRTVHHLDVFADSELAALQERSVRGAARHYVVSDLWRRELALRYDLGGAFVVPNGVDLARFSPATPAAREAMRARFGIEPSAPFFVAIGGVEKRKNALGTLAAFARVRERHPTARLTIAGGASVFDHGAYRTAFDALASELGLRLGTDAIVTGPLPDDDIRMLLRAADALVFPSLVEGFGLVVLEALACGTPVVTSDVPPFTEYLAPHHAIFVDPDVPDSIAAGMMRALDPAIAAALRERGPRVAARFTWADSAAAHADRYREYLAYKEPIRA
jgi:glycosyltransferase-like protein